MIKHVRIAALSVLPLAFATPVQVLAQTSLSDSESQANKEQLEQRAQQVMGGASSNAATYGSLGSALQVSTDADDTNASLSLSFKRTHPIGGGREDGINGPVKFSYASELLSVTAKAPLGKNGKPSLFDFDQLGDGTSLKIGFARYSGSYTYRRASDPASLITRTNSLINRCIDIGSGVWVSKQNDKAEALKFSSALRTKVDAFVKANPRSSFENALSSVAKSTKPEDKDLVPLAKFLGQQCASWSGDDNSGGAVLTALMDDQSELEGDEGIKGIWFIGGSGTIARTNYKYLTQAPLAKADVSKTNYKLQTYAGWIFPSGKASVAASFGYVRSFKPADEVQLCEPNGNGQQIACFEGPLGAPTPIKRYIVAGEGRFLWKLGKSESAPTIGLAPSASYEWKSKAFLLELPVYLVPDKDGKRLNGGIRVAYDTGKDDLAFGLFVGVPFSVFFN